MLLAGLPAASVLISLTSADGADVGEGELCIFLEENTIIDY